MKCTSNFNCSGYYLLRLFYINSFSKSRGNLLFPLTMRWLTLFCAVAFLDFVYSALPLGIVPCPKNDFKCMAERGTSTIKKILNGDASLKIPSLSPLVIPKVILDGAAGLHISFTDLEIHGLDGLSIADLKFDYGTQSGVITFHLDRMLMLGDYKSSGKIMIFEVSGDGKANMTIIKGKATYEFNYELEKKKGDEFIKITKDHTSFKTDRVFFDFTHIFPDDQITQRANQVFNDEWEAVVQEVEPGISAVIGDVAKLISNIIFGKIPMKELFS